MSFFDVLARWLGLSDPAPTADPFGGSRSIDTAAGVGPRPPVPAASAAPVAYGAYAELWRSVDRHLAQFMAHSVLPHRQFEPDDVFRMVRIQVTGTTAAAQAAIDSFLAEFRPESRRKAVLAAVARNCPQGVSTEGFVDFNRDFDQADLDDSDPYDAQLAQAYQGGYQLTLYGEWEPQRPPAPGASAQAASAGDATALAAPLRLDIDDAVGRRELHVATLPFAIGRTAAAGQAVSGKFVSRRHGLLERDGQGRVWWRDTSVNGSSIDGAAVAPGERRPLHNGARLRLGGESTDAAECPGLVVRWPATPDEDDASTPLRALLRDGGAVDAATPLRSPLNGGADDSNGGTSAPSAAASPRAPLPGPLCVLAVKDAHGSRSVAVTRLPYVIGRSELADCRVPEDNAGVSREHLVIRTLDAVGAQIDNGAAAKWGTQLDGAEQPARFTLGWGRQVTLAGRFAKAPAVTLLLLPASS